ncbi:NACHTdomain protein [Colletotrichum chrysophilum]|uniref:NACHTdomain protein n=1 Tax=Colletotrichum chrysophilum TaxID=1836956 RepID=A0AAD9ALB4_9PEZI|nr:NACHTdomain protein [Colletotrichum chrysophilum]
MDEALEDLKKTMNAQDMRDIEQTSLSDVRTAALHLESELASRRSLRNMQRLTPLFQGLEHYASAMNVMCNGTPFLPWAWAPITLILRISCEYVEAFQQIMNGYSRIAEALKRFEILDDAFSGDCEFSATIAAFYEDILEFHKHAYKFVRRNGWKILFMTSWGRFQRRFDNILKVMEQHATLIDREANARNIAEAREMRNDLREWRKQKLLDLSREDDHEVEQQYRSILAWLKVDQSDQIRIMDSIAKEKEKYSDVRDWITQSDKVKSWLKWSRAVSTLWIQGVPGAGKTFIAAQLVRYLRTAKMPFLHHFCSNSYASSTPYEQVVRSLISQAVTRDKDRMEFVHKDFAFSRKVPTLKVLEDLLGRPIASSSTEPSQTDFIWVIIDGLDECSSETQTYVLHLLKRIAAKTSCSTGTILKVLVVSQASPEISSHLRRKTVLSLSDERENMSRAIRQYTAHRLRLLYRKFQNLNLTQQDYENVSDDVVRKADGMFLYARLVLDYLNTNIFLRREEVMSSLSELPDTLMELYQRLLTQVLGNLDNRSVNRVRCVFGWVAFQKRPLKRLELLSAISFSGGDPDITNIAPDYILDTCSPLLDQRPDTTIAFIHSTVKRFLSDLPNPVAIKEQDAISEHGLATVACLLSGLKVYDAAFDEDRRRSRTVKGLHGLHVYSTEHWKDYLSTLIQRPGWVDTKSVLLERACDPAEQLEDLSPSYDLGSVDGTLSALNMRLQATERYKMLKQHLEAFLASRSRRAIEKSYRRSDNGQGNSDAQQTQKDISPLSSALQVYQRTVQYLLGQHAFPGVSAEALQSIKSQFSSAIFTCRLQSCPRATVGFETPELLRDHEVDHTRRYLCLFHGCQYPSFASAEALRRHSNKVHRHPEPPKIVRRRQTGSERQPAHGKLETPMEPPIEDPRQQMQEETKLPRPGRLHPDFSDAEIQQVQFPQVFNSSDSMTNFQKLPAYGSGLTQQDEPQQYQQIDSLQMDDTTRMLPTLKENQRRRFIANNGDQVYNDMMSQMNAEQRYAIQQLPPDKLQEVMEKWLEQQRRNQQMQQASFNRGGY